MIRRRVFAEVFVVLAIALTVSCGVQSAQFHATVPAKQGELVAFTASRQSVEPLPDDGVP